MTRPALRLAKIEATPPLARRRLSREGQRPLVELVEGIEHGPIVPGLLGCDHQAFRQQESLGQGVDIVPPGGREGGSARRVTEVIDGVLQMDVKHVQLRRWCVQNRLAFHGIPASDAIQQECLEVHRVRGCPRDETGQVEVKAPEGRGSAGAPLAGCCPSSTYRRHLADPAGTQRITSLNQRSRVGGFVDHEQRKVRSLQQLQAVEQPRPHAVVRLEYLVPPRDVAVGPRVGERLHDRIAHSDADSLDHATLRRRAGR